MRPALSAITGLRRAAARAAERNLRGARIALELEQDRPRRAVHRQQVEEVAGVGVGHGAERDDAAEADAALGGPVDHRRGDRARLREQRQPPAAPEP